MYCVGTAFKFSTEKVVGVVEGVKEGAVEKELVIVTPGVLVDGILPNSMKSFDFETPNSGDSLLVIL